jgi:hypothetical protein
VSRVLGSGSGPGPGGCAAEWDGGQRIGAALRTGSISSGLVSGAVSGNPLFYPLCVVSVPTDRLFGRDIN